MQTGTLLIDSALYDSCCSFWDAYVAEACRCARRRRPLRRPPSPDTQPRRRPLRTASVQTRLQHAPRAPAQPPCTAKASSCGAKGGGGGVGAATAGAKRGGGGWSGGLPPARCASRAPDASTAFPARRRDSRRRSASVPPTQPRCRCVYRRLAPCVRRHAAAANASERATLSADPSGSPSARSSPQPLPAPPATRAIPAPVPALAAAAAAAAPQLSPRGRTPACAVHGAVGGGAGSATAQGDDGPFRWATGRGAAPGASPGTGGGRRGPRGHRGQRRERAQRWRRGQHFDGPPPPPPPPLPHARPAVNFAQGSNSRDPGIRHIPFQPPSYDWNGASCYVYDDVSPPDAPFYFFPYWPNIPGSSFNNYFCLDEHVSLDFLNAGMSKMPVQMDMMLSSLTVPQPQNPPPNFVDPQNQNEMQNPISTLVANVSFRIAHLAEFFSDPFKEELFLELADTARGECECFEVVELADKHHDNIQPLQLDGSLIQHIVQEDVLKNFIRNLEEENNAKNINNEDSDSKNGFYTDYRDSDYEWYQPNGFKKSENGNTGWDYRFTYNPSTDAMNGVFMVESMKNYQDIWLKQ